MIAMSVQETMTILAFASKACELKGRLKLESDKSQPLEYHAMDMAQFEALANQSVDILKRIDADYPGMLAVPHDGVPWKDR